LPFLGSSGSNGSSSLFFFLPVNPNLSLALFRRGHQLPDCGKYYLELGIIPLLKFIKFPD